MTFKLAVVVPTIACFDEAPMAKGIIRTIRPEAAFIPSWLPPNDCTYLADQGVDTLILTDIGPRGVDTARRERARGLTVLRTIDLLYLKLRAWTDGAGSGGLAHPAYGGVVVMAGIDHPEMPLYVQLLHDGRVEGDDHSEWWLRLLDWVSDEVTLAVVAPGYLPGGHLDYERTNALTPDEAIAIRLWDVKRRGLVDPAAAADDDDDEATAAETDEPPPHQPLDILGRDWPDHLYFSIPGRGSRG